VASAAAAAAAAAAVDLTRDEAVRVSIANEERLR